MTDDQAPVVDSGTALDEAVKAFQASPSEHTPQVPAPQDATTPRQSGFVRVSDHESAVRQAREEVEAREAHLREQIQGLGADVDAEGNLILPATPATPPLQPDPGMMQQQVPQAAPQFNWEPMKRLAENFGIPAEELVAGVAPIIAAAVMPLYQREVANTVANTQARIKSRLAEQALIDPEASVYLRSLQADLQQLDPQSLMVLANDDGWWQRAVDMARGRHLNDIISRRGSQPTVRGGRVMEGASSLAELPSQDDLPDAMTDFAKRQGFDPETVARAAGLRRQRLKQREY